MATTITGRTNSSLWTFKIVATEGAYSTPNNTSPLRVDVFIGRASSRSYMTGADINVTVSVTGCSAKSFNYRNTGTVYINGGDWLNIGYAYFEAVPHDADGSKNVYLTANFSQSGVTPSSGSAAGYVTLTTIPRAVKLTSCPTTWTDEENPTIKYSNSAGNIFANIETCISFDGSNPDVPYRDLSYNGNSYTFNLTEAERDTLRKGTLNNSTSRKLWFFIRSEFTDGEIQYSKLESTFTVVNCDPTFNPTIVDTNQATVELTGNSSIIVGRKSIVSVSSGAAGAKHATITSQYIQAAGKTINGGSGTVTDPTSGYFRFTATDNRGITVSHEKLQTFVDYVPVSCKQDLTIGLDGSNGTDAKANIVISGTYFNASFGKSNNHLTLYYRYKVVGTDWSTQSNDGWKEVTDTITKSDGTYRCSIEVAGLNQSQEYVFQCMAQDALSYTFSPERSVQTRPVFDWSKDDFCFNVPVTFKAGITPIEGTYQAPIDIPANTDLSTITAPGLYRCKLNATAATLTNCPTNLAFIMEVIPNNVVTQRITEHEVAGMPSMFMRNYYNNKWCRWYEYVPRLNNTGDPVNLFNISIDFQNEGTYYKFPSDGYLVIRASYRSGYYVVAKLCGESGEGTTDHEGEFEITVTSGSSTNTQGNPTNAIYVRKGMVLKQLDRNSDSYNSAMFYPLS